MISDNNGGHVDYSATFNQEEDIYYVHVAPRAPQAQSAASRKLHSSAGTFDIPLPLSGSPGVECRSGPNHQIIVDFASPVTVGNAMVTSGTATARGFSVNGSEVAVDLTGVGNAQVVTLTLGSVNDGTNFGSVSVTLGLLAGDVNGNSSVNGTDVSQTKAAGTQSVAVIIFAPT